MKKYLRLWAPKEDVEWVADHLRPEDAREIETASGKSAKLGVLNGALISSTLGCAGFKGRPPFLLFGVAPASNGAGAVWLLATPEVSQAGLWVARQARKVLPKLMQGHQYLHNMADCRNELHLRWLSLMGFTFGPDIDVNGHPFRYFFMTKEHLCANQLQSSLA